MNSAGTHLPFLAFLACLQLGLGVLAGRAQTLPPAQKPAVFRVKYVAEDAVYIDGGRDADLQEGMKLSVVQAPADGTLSEGVRYRGDRHIAELRVSSLANSSSVCEVLEKKDELRAGQLAFLDPDSLEQRQLAESAAEADKYPILVTFTNGDPLDEEIREKEETKVTRESPMSRIRGRFGFDFGGTTESGGFNSKQVGLVIDADMSNLGGTYWNFTGYWRGILTTSSSGVTASNTQTLTDLINRTYHLGFTYQSPYSPNIIGVGRVFLPWAPSLSTIDGGYFGRKIAEHIIAGVFAGSTPDPTSWSYVPNQHIAGTFVNYETGRFDSARLYSTAGIAITTVHWRAARQFVFFENDFSWKRYVMFYNSMQVDAARTSPLPNGGSSPTGVSRSYTSVHFQPVTRVIFGINYNYFRNLPTFDPRLVGAGLLDQYLFQGFSGDVRVELPAHIALYSSLGRSNVSTDPKTSLNQAYGISFAQIWKTGLFADLHYSKFDSSFGGGQYESLSLSRSLTDRLRVQVLAGHQILNTNLSSNLNSNFVNAVADCNVGSRYFLEGNFGWYQGTSLSYRQWSVVFGYRFGGYRHR